jgi:hypothetical protein
MTKSVTFRCPDDLLSEIDEFGQQNYPANTESGCDRSKTLIFILQAGLQALSEGSVEVTSKTCQTSKTIEPSEFKLALRDELLSEFNELVRRELTGVRQEFDERLAALGERLA